VKDYFNSLNDREKWMVIIGGISLLIYSFYFFLLSPITSRVQLRSAQLTEKIDTLAWMNKVSGEGHNLQQKENLDNSKLLTLLSAELKDNEELNFPFQMQQTSSGEIQLTFDEVPLKVFITWLAELNKKYTLSIKQLEVERTKKPGITHLRIVISGGG